LRRVSTISATSIRAYRPHYPRVRAVFAQLTATRSGLGLCVLPIFIAERYPELQVVLEDEIDLCRHYWLACHHDIRQVARVRTVIEFLRGVVSDNALAFTGRPLVGHPVVGAVG